MTRHVLTFAAALTTAAILGAAFVIQAQPSAATAQSGTGSVKGRVLWCSGVPYPVPLVPGAEGGGAPSEVTPAQPPETTPDQTAPNGQGGAPVPGIAIAPDSRPIPIPPRGLPAGAVLVAVQGTALSTRTDENGRFTLDGVPAGQYLTLAAGPVQATGNAIALRPNVFLNASQTVDLGTLYLTPGASTACGNVRFGAGAAPASPDSEPNTAP